MGASLIAPGGGGRGQDELSPNEGGCDGGDGAAGGVAIANASQSPAPVSGEGGTGGEPGACCTTQGHGGNAGKGGSGNHSGKNGVGGFGSGTSWNRKGTLVVPNSWDPGSGGGGTDDGGTGGGDFGGAGGGHGCSGSGAGDAWALANTVYDPELSPNAPSSPAGDGAVQFVFQPFQCEAGQSSVTCKLPTNQNSIELATVLAVADDAAEAAGLGPISDADAMWIRAWGGEGAPEKGGSAGGAHGLAQTVTSYADFTDSYGSTLYYYIGNVGDDNHAAGKGGASSLVSTEDLSEHAACLPASKTGCNILLVAAGGGGGGSNDSGEHGGAGGTAVADTGGDAHGPDAAAPGCCGGGGGSEGSGGSVGSDGATVAAVGLAAWATRCTLTAVSRLV